MLSEINHPFKEKRLETSKFPQAQSDHKYNSKVSTYRIHNENNNVSHCITPNVRLEKFNPSQISQAISKESVSDKLHECYKANRFFSNIRTGYEPQLLNTQEDVFSVRRAALTVLDPLTHIWLIISAGFSTTCALAMARWTNLLPTITLGLVLLPSWLSHLCLFLCHVRSARALTIFIAEANDNRQIQDSTDNLDRTEYLPLLQRSLRYFIKTAFISICSFVFEVLIYLRLTKGSVSLTAALSPIWIIVLAGIIDGVLCKTQSGLRLFCWILVMTYMLLLVLRVDHMFEFRWFVIIGPIIALLCIFIAYLIHILYGHKIGYFKLTESQLRAGILYSVGVIICIVILAIHFMIHLTRPLNIELKIVLIALPPLVLALFGLGGYAINRDELERLYQYGGQAAVYPMKLILQPSGWTAIMSKGVTNLPMFGEVHYELLNADTGFFLNICYACNCFQYQREKEENVCYHEYHADYSCFSSKSMNTGVQYKTSKRVT